MICGDKGQTIQYLYLQSESSTKEIAAKNKRIQKVLVPKLQADPRGLDQANSKRKLPPKNKRIQKLIAPKLKADPSGLN